MTLMTGITNANQALAAEDLEGDLFEVVGGKVVVRRYKPVDGFNPPGTPGLVPLADLVTPTDLLEPGDGLGSPANQAYQMLRADGTWGTQNIFVTTQAANTVSANQPSPNNSGGTAYPAFGNQQFYSPIVTVDLVGSSGTKNSPIPIPYYPVVATIQTTPIHAGGMLPSALTLGGRKDVYFGANGKWEILPTTPPTGTPAGHVLRADGTWGAPAAATTHTASWDAVGKNLTTVVNGVSAVTSLASLDDEAVSMAFSAGTLQLKNASGTVLSSTPVPDLDAQTLSIGGTAAAPTIAISSGNSVPLPVTPTTNSLAYFGATASSGPQLASTVNGVQSLVPIAAIVSCTNISTAFNLPPIAAANIVGTDQLLGKDCRTYQINALPINGSQIVGPLPASALPPTTNTAVWSKAGGLVDTTNGVASTVAVPVGVIADFIGYSSAGTPVNQALNPVVVTVETYRTVAASYTIPTPAPVLSGLSNTTTIESLIEVTAAGATITMPPPASVPVGVEIDIKATGTWTGQVVLSSSATIDGATTFVFNKATAAAQPARSLRSTGSKWLIV